ncbi:MAG: hypothetical protein PF495_05210 [Spirochaetales bacterium]|jgi:hypothetical protein|nr:hypothetical protein [Spirochaetales bacterium]
MDSAEMVRTHLEELNHGPNDPKRAAEQIVDILSGLYDTQRTMRIIEEEAQNGKLSGKKVLSGIKVEKGYDMATWEELLSLSIKVGELGRRGGEKIDIANPRVLWTSFRVGTDVEDVKKMLHELADKL